MWSHSPFISSPVSKSHFFETEPFPVNLSKITSGVSIFEPIALCGIVATVFGHVRDCSIRPLGRIGYQDMFRLGCNLFFLAHVV